MSSLIACTLPFDTAPFDTTPCHCLYSTVWFDDSRVLQENTDCLNILRIKSGIDEGYSIFLGRIFDLSSKQRLHEIRTSDEGCHDQGFKPSFSHVIIDDTVPMMAYCYQEIRQCVIA